MLSFVSERNFWVDIPVEMCGGHAGVQESSGRAIEVLRRRGKVVGEGERREGGGEEGQGRV